MHKTHNNSKQRKAVLEAIRSTDTHPSVRWIHEQVKTKLPGISLGTIYRNIKVCREEGSVVSVGVVNNEERFDGIVEPHPHAVCTKCGRIIDIDDLPEAENIHLSGFTVDKRRTVFYGTCVQCCRAGKNLLAQFGRLRKGFSHN
ncbi:ferric uptake regulation proteins [Candidatus Termititenax persephonae]|uniref:Ferric uptake regulation proteins n=1 Tax=Candidatus Termititenax persephonae TaxID=2218525 RepID=A0A388TI99_9BACT|nr:ferric uptake regulation proteins [Candidatus Termititenax persephonae]